MGRGDVLVMAPDDDDREVGPGWLRGEVTFERRERVAGEELAGHQQAADTSLERVLHVGPGPGQDAAEAALLKEVARQPTVAARCPHNDATLVHSDACDRCR
jgi:hypothetical protein